MEIGIDCYFSIAEKNACLRFIIVRNYIVTYEMAKSAYLIIDRIISNRTINPSTMMIRVLVVIMMMAIYGIEDKLTTTT